MAYTTINKPSLYFNTVTYSGNGTNPTSITSVGFKPDWLWIKCRSNIVSNLLFDAVRGVSKRLISNSSAAETTETQIASFDTNGWTMDADTANNGSGRTYVAWNWLGANTTASNTQGSITSTVSANTTSGFSIVSYTGTGATATIGHGLGVAPKMIIVKQRSAIRDWVVGHSGIGWTKYLYLNSTQASAIGNFFNDTTPSSTVFNVVNDGGVNASSGTYIAYCFAEVKGFSAFGSYTGNGSTDGTFIYTGFKPAFLLIKRTDAAFGWFIFDNKRDTYNVASNYLLPYATDAEASLTTLDILSNGFKIRQSLSYINASGGTYIYMAFAENPFVSATLIPTTAR